MLRRLYSVWPATLRAAEGAMGGGKHFKIRPPDKEDAFPHGVSTACGEATPTVAVYRVQRPRGAQDRRSGERKVAQACPPIGAVADGTDRVWRARHRCRASADAA